MTFFKLISIYLDILSGMLWLLSILMILLSLFGQILTDFPFLLSKTSNILSAPFYRPLEVPYNWHFILNLLPFFKIRGMFSGKMIIKNRSYLVTMKRVCF